ncbi:MAG: AAA family ATPase [Muribaculaceae bacterium]|nr:AAA family ATPase [Muribaculaceae bacterium]
MEDNEDNNVQQPSEGSRPLVDAALATLPFTPHPDQLTLLKKLSDFTTKGERNAVFILNGYAGTGKTSMVGAFIKALKECRRKVVIVAPTGRAAKVAQSFSGHPASTIHKLLYRGNSLDPGNTTFYIARNTTPDTIFIVDEASMISDAPDSSGRSLLHHLAHYVYSCPGCRMILVGDEAQLPPVGQTQSAAMRPERLREMGLIPRTHSLDLPVRQAAMSGIVHNATYIRHRLFYPDSYAPNALFLKDFDDVVAISSEELAERLATSHAEVGEDETLIITRSNKRANNFNQAIRNIVMYAEEPLERGDRVVISKNDYFWAKQNDMKGFIANGETAEVTWVGKTEKAYGRYFTDVELRFITDGRIMGAKVMLRSLVCEGPAIPRAEMEKFYGRVMEAYDGELSEKIKGAMEDPFYNALQMKYAYCVTCHKAQGGQWAHVYIDMGGIAAEAMDAEFNRWLYTAITRATKKVFFINPTMELM